ncbi:MAG: efflux RND transporter permease subunit [Rhodobacteraceae bacterium]|nr:efflux RND transporter permease subunit [Paracoccaceae bacterium]
MVRDIPKSAGGLLSYFTRHKTAANLLLVILLVAGLMAVPRMRAQFFPDVIVDNISISFVWKGAGAEDVDAAIVQVVEPTLLAIEGVTGANSTSREGSARIDLEFEPEWDMARAKADVETALDLIPSLPEDAEDPTITRSSWSDRVTDVIISGPVEIEQLGQFADEFVLRLFNEGVTRTTIRGVAAPEVIVEVPTANLIKYNTTMRQIASVIAEEVSADPAGDVSGANTRVRTGIEKRSVDEIQSIVLGSNSDGSTLTIGDVARVFNNGVDRERAYFVGEDQAVTVRVDRSQKGDAIDIQHQVEGIAQKLEATLPAGTNIELIRTRAEYISGRLNILVNNGISGLILVLGLLFLFLNARTAFWVAAGIPTAMMTAIAIMYFAGLTFNMISLFALIITLGIVVDDAIVVGEHADQRARRGLPPIEAAETAAIRMAMPVLAATITTVIAFFGLTAIGGRFGDLIADIPFTVIVVLLASLVECFLILPNHMAHSLGTGDRIRWYDRPSYVVNIAFEWARDTLFRRFIYFVVRTRYVMLAGALVLLASQVTLVISGKVAWRFFAAPELSSVTGNFAMLNTATREDTLAMTRELQRAVEELGKSYEERHGRNPVEYVLVEIGGNSGRALPGTENKSADLLGGISIEIIEPDFRPYSSFAFVGELQDAVREHPLLETLSFRGWRSGPGGDALDVQFYGADAQTLKAASEDLKTALARFPQVSAVEDDLSYDKEELILELTPQGQALGFTIDGLGSVLRNRLNGVEAATYPLGSRSAAIRVELPQQELTSDFLERMQLRAPNGIYVPIADIVSVERRSGFSTVRRENGIRLISVTGDIAEDNPEDAVAVSEALENDILPRIASERQVDWRLSGLAEQENEFLNDARTGLILCLVGIYLTLTWVFASWTRPIVVMAVIPFGLVGAIWGHYMWDISMSLFTVVGLLGMIGIIINDSIVLITTIDEYAKDRGLIPSVIDAAADRLRPVMLTTLTTVLGLGPLLYERSSQAEFLKPTVVTLVFGLGFGMALVLIIVPSLIAIQNDFKRFRVSLMTGLTMRNLKIRALFVGSTLAICAWLLATMGWVIMFDRLPSGLQPLVSAVGGTNGIAAAFALFLAGSVLWITLLFLTTHFAALANWVKLRRQMN